MYEELVKRLRHDSESRALMLEASDAIEELSREYESIAKSLTESVELMRKRKAHADSYDLLYEEGGANTT